MFLYARISEETSSKPWVWSSFRFKGQLELNDGNDLLQVIDKKFVISWTGELWCRPEEWNTEVFEMWSFEALKYTHWRSGKSSLYIFFFQILKRSRFTLSQTSLYKVSWNCSFENLKRLHFKKTLKHLIPGRWDANGYWLRVSLFLPNRKTLRNDLMYKMKIGRAYE